MVLAAVVALVLAAAAPALAESGSANNSGKLVDIGGGREMYMECQGTGYPTVVFVAGAQDRAETWSTTKDPSEQFRILLYNAWHDAIGDLVSQVPGARFIDDPHSGHYIHQEQPQLVIDSIREVLYAVEQQSPLTDTGGVPPSVFLLASALLLGTSILVARRALRAG